MSSKIGSPLPAITLECEHGTIPHKPMWFLPDGNYAIHNGIDLILIGPRDFLELVEHYRVTYVVCHWVADGSKTRTSYADVMATWGPEVHQVDPVDCTVDRTAEQPIAESSASRADEIQDSVPTGPPVLEVPEDNAVEVSNPPDIPFHDDVSIIAELKVAPVPMVLGVPETNHTVYNMLARNGSLGAITYRNGAEWVETVSYKRIRFGHFGVRVDDTGHRSIEVDPNRIDTSTGWGTSKRVLPSFSLFSR